MTCDHCPGAVHVILTKDPETDDITVHWLCYACGRIKDVIPEWCDAGEVEAEMKRRRDYFLAEW